ncbi:TonB-dependent receptor [Flavobacterium cellulosilyticum]|uniref:TonB-dependent receptor n=1 Tax=Flavobacterium cellulosilyticum TaxID=2541731 RepID=A0A4V2YYL4_9FLAO|nr:TonB-dependent receptor [Flavobacterium cellulosilyticum]TDD93677.1 TonB-dependent receptor [Flavobacterium cellulosilyticum]
MKKIIAIIILTMSSYSIRAQNTVTFIIKDKEENDILFGANCILKNTTTGTSSDENGICQFNDIPNGEQTFEFSYIGFESVEKTYTFPLKNKQPIVIYLTGNTELQAVTVFSTRTRDRIKEIPTKIEVLGIEEVVEETAINPGNISKLLGETSGIQVQHTSAISGNVSFRIQGLPGKYTQLLKDGFPSYGGFSSGLSLLQIPPLDLKQVEIIKGSASTLYGDGAIAGIVNLISKIPKEKPEFTVMINQTHKGGNDVSTYFSGENGKLGATLIASINTQKAKDISNNGFLDLPEYNRAVIAPKLFYTLDENNKFEIGFSNVTENRIGGNLKAINDEIDSNHPFFEENKTKRLTSTIRYENTKKKGNVLTLKASFGNFDRTLKTNTNIFSGVQKTVFSELSYYIENDKHKFVSGINFNIDDFDQKQPNTFNLNYNYQTLGVFSQDNWKIADKLFLEPGIRLDYNFKKGLFFLPRLATMYHVTDNFFTRLSGGFGYKLPTPFTDEAERTRYQSVDFSSGLKTEKSMGLNLDFNFKTELADELFLTLNQAFFITKIENPIIANQSLLVNQIVKYETANGSIVSKGLNTNLRLSLDELILYVDYTYLNPTKTYEQNKILEYTPINKLTCTLAYEDEEEHWKVGLEAFYFGNQYRENGTITPNYWLLGASAQKGFGHYTVAINFENILDVRQTRYENIVSGSINNPNFNELYAPLDGFVGNIVLKYDLY